MRQVFDAALVIRGQGLRRENTGDFSPTCLHLPTSAQDPIKVSMLLNIFCLGEVRVKSF